MRWLLTWGYFKSIPENVDNPKINLPCGAMWGWSIPVIYGDFGDGLLGLPHDPALKLMQWFCHTFSTQCQTPWVNSIQIPRSLAMKTEWSRPRQIYLSRKGQSLTHPLQMILKLRNLKLKHHFNFKHNASPGSTEKPKNIQHHPTCASWAYWCEL